MTTVQASEPAPESAPYVERLEIVDRAIEFHGGTLYESSESSLQVCSKSGCFVLRAKMDGGLFEYEVEGKTRSGLRWVRMTNDETEVKLDGQPVEPSTEQIQGYRDWVMARVYFPFLPYRLNDPGVRKQDLGTETWGDVELQRVRVTFPSGSSTDADDIYTYWFDQDGRMAQFAYSYEGNPGGVRFRRLSNFRRVGGLLFSDQANLGAEGEGLSPDDLNPESVNNLRAISQVSLKNIEVRSLAAPSKAP